MFICLTSIDICILLPGTYLETDFDRSVTRDISVHSRPEASHARQMSAPVEHQHSDMLRQPARVDRDSSPYRQSQMPRAGHSGRRSPDKVPELTGGRYPAYRDYPSESTPRSPQSRQQQQQWYSQSGGQPRTAAESRYAPRRTGSNENVHYPRAHAVNIVSSALFVPKANLDCCFSLYSMKNASYCISTGLIVFSIT